MLWLTTLYLEHEATIQERVKKYHLCLVFLMNMSSYESDNGDIDNVDVSFDNRVMGVGLSRWRVGANECLRVCHRHLLLACYVE